MARQPVGAWHTRRPDLLDEIRRDLAQRYPSLHVVVDADCVRVCGTLPITHDGRELERYAIEIRFAADYPDSIPEVRETSGRIPKTDERHFDGDGTACLFVPDERDWIWPVGASFLEFLDGPVRTFFLAQSIVSLGGEWPHGERSHHALGLIEFYQKLLDTDDVALVFRYVAYLARSNPKGLPCPCGSGLKAKKCHREQLRELRVRIPANVAYRTLTQLRELETLVAEAGSAAAPEASPNSRNTSSGHD